MHMHGFCLTSDRPEVMMDNLKNRKEGWTAERVMVAFVGNILLHVTLSQ